MDGQQNVAARYMYSPFGKLVGMWGPMADVNTLQFSSMQWHANSGLSLYPFRGYDPTLQRWLNRDPLGERGDLNLYRGMFNSPLNVVDRSGRDNMYATPEQINANTINNAPVNVVLNLTPQMQEILHPSIPVLQAEGSFSIPPAPGYTEMVPTGNHLLSTDYGGDDPLVQMPCGPESTRG